MIARLREEAKSGLPAARVPQLAERAKFLLVTKSACDPDSADIQVPAATSAPSDVDGLNAVSSVGVVSVTVTEDAQLRRAVSVGSSLTTVDDGSLMLDRCKSVKVATVAEPELEPEPEPKNQPLKPSAALQRLDRQVVGATKGDLADRMLDFLYRGKDSPGVLQKLATESTRVALSRLAGLQLLRSLMEFGKATGSAMYDAIWCLSGLLHSPALGDSHLLGGFWIPGKLQIVLQAEFHGVIQGSPFPVK